MLINFLSNAVKYSPRAETVIVHAAADASQVTIGVQDFGVGIAVADREHVFERYYRVHQNTLEQLVIFIPGLYTFAVLVSPLWAAIVGVVFIITDTAPTEGE